MGILGERGGREGEWVVEERAGREGECWGPGG